MEFNETTKVFCDLKTDGGDFLLHTKIHHSVFVFFNDNRKSHDFL